jgi:hypothetical protein
LILEEELNQLQAKLVLHENYFINTLGGSNIVLLSTLLPAFLVGWSCAGHNKQGKQKSWRFIKFVFVSVLASLRKRLAS